VFLKEYLSSVIGPSFLCTFCKYFCEKRVEFLWGPFYKGFPLRPGLLWVVGLELSKDPTTSLICCLKFLPLKSSSALKMGEIGASIPI
jgi:hypothetical protein